MNITELIAVRNQLFADISDLDDLDLIQNDSGTLYLQGFLSDPVARINIELPAAKDITDFYKKINSLMVKAQKDEDKYYEGKLKTIAKVGKARKMSQSRLQKTADLEALSMLNTSLRRLCNAKGFYLDNDEEE